MKTAANAMQWHIEQNTRKWLEFRDTPVWCEFVEALDEEQRERVGKYFGRAVKTMHLGAVAEGGECWFVGDVETAESDMRAEFAWFIRQVLNPKGNKAIPYAQIGKLFGAVAEGLEAEVAGLEGRKGLGKLAAAMKRDIFK